MENDLYAWMHDDITWCASDCSHTECYRHPSNRLLKQGLYSASFFKDTQMCPLYNEGRDEPLNTDVSNTKVDL